VLGDGAKRHELAGGARGHLGPVVRHRQQDGSGLVVDAQLDQAVGSGLDLGQEPLGGKSISKDDLDLGGGLLDRDDVGDPLARDQSSTTLTATLARGKCVYARPRPPRPSSPPGGRAGERSRTSATGSRSAWSAVRLGRSLAPGSGMVTSSSTGRGDLRMLTDRSSDLYRELRRKPYPW
jgi:hypothetical protein